MVATIDTLLDGNNRGDGPTAQERDERARRRTERWTARRTRLAGVGRLALAFIRGPRRATLRSGFLGIGALACYVAAGLTVNLTVGLIIAGLGLSVLDWRTAPVGVPDGTDGEARAGG